MSDINTIPGHSAVRGSLWDFRHAAWIAARELLQRWRCQWQQWLLCLCWYSDDNYNIHTHSSWTKTINRVHTLQKIQNWTARLVDSAMRYSHATPLLKKLHWLPIAVRVEFKILLFTHRALNGQASDYIEQCVSRRQPVMSLRSSEHRRHWGDRTFRVAAPSLWNALPQHLTSSMTTATLKLKLKTYLL